jgi:hypothetical protein
MELSTFKLLCIKPSRHGRRVTVQERELDDAVKAAQIFKLWSQTPRALVTLYKDGVVVDHYLNIERVA